MRFSLDTNILVYSIDQDAGARHHRARELVEQARHGDLVLTLQCLCELFRVLLRRGKTVEQARRLVAGAHALAPLVASDVDCLFQATDWVDEHGWSFWDAMMLATVSKAGCRMLITEDGQHGRTISGVAIVNPFRDDSGSLLAQALGS